VHSVKIALSVANLGFFLCTTMRALDCANRFRLRVRPMLFRERKNKLGLAGTPGDVLGVPAVAVC